MPRRVTLGSRDKENFDQPESVSKCRRIVATILQAEQVSFSSDASGAGVQYELSGPGAVQASADDREYKALTFLDVNDIRYWISIILQYRFALGLLQLSQVSVVVFVGLEADKEPLLRAEWDRVDEVPAPHAQPHWHVYRSAINHALGSTPSSVTRMHFAMAALWHVPNGGSNAHYCEPSEECLHLWLSGCLSYLQAELRYMTRRAS